MVENKIAPRTSARLKVHLTSGPAEIVVVYDVITADDKLVGIGVRKLLRVVADAPEAVWPQVKREQFTGAEMDRLMRLIGESVMHEMGVEIPPDTEVRSMELSGVPRDDVTKLAFRSLDQLELAMTAIIKACGEMNADALMAAIKRGALALEHVQTNKGIVNAILTKDLSRPQANDAAGPRH